MPDTATLFSRVHLKIDGSDVSAEFMRDLLEITVESSLHMPDVATIVLDDPRLRWIDEALVAPGSSLQILTAEPERGKEPRSVFDGETVELEPGFSQGTHHLAIRAFDRLHRLSRGRKVRSFQNVTDSDVARRMAREAGLQADVEATRQVHEYLFQNNQTDYEFLRQRAAALGYLVFAEGKKLCFKPPVHDASPVELRWAANLSEFRPRLTTISQVSWVTSRGWDPRTRKEIVSDVSDGKAIRDIGEQKQGGVFAKDAFQIDAADLVFDQPVHSQAAADGMAKAVADRHDERFVEADGSCGGNPSIVAGASVKIDAVGVRFSGSYLVTSATHIYNRKEGYSTQFSISGQTPFTLLRLLRTEETRQAGAGLVIGIVTDNQDPDGWGRVKVKYPWLSAEHASNWARVVSAGGGKERGIEFLPEVNDEVLIGFEMGDIHHPYVIGGLWNGQDAPPRRNSEIIAAGQINQRIIRSRTGHIIVLDDSDGSSGITIEDKNGNRIELDSSTNGLTLDVKGNISIRAGGQVEIKGSVINLN
jgi:phage protein D